MFRSLTRRWQVLALALGVAACTGQEAARVPLSERAVSDSVQRADAARSVLGAGAQAALDSANALFRTKQYARALEQYRAASRLAPEHAAPLFGQYMVAQATRNVKLADSVLAEIRKRGGPRAPAVHDFPDPALKAMRRKAVKGLPGG